MKLEIRDFDVFKRHMQCLLDASQHLANTVNDSAERSFYLGQQRGIGLLYELIISYRTIQQNRVLNNYEPAGKPTTSPCS